jgi:hypothetical protein
MTAEIIEKLQEKATVLTQERKKRGKTVPEVGNGFILKYSKFHIKGFQRTPRQNNLPSYA